MSTTGKPSEATGVDSRRIASRFVKLVGSDANAIDLVEALHVGHEVDLLPVAGREDDDGPVCIPLQARSMPWNDVRITLLHVQDVLVRAWPTEPAGRWLEARGNARPRGMTVADRRGATPAGPSQNPAYRPASHFRCADAHLGSVRRWMASPATATPPRLCALIPMMSMSASGKASEPTGNDARRIASRFVKLVGSDANAIDLVEALHGGFEVELLPVRGREDVGDPVCIPLRGACMPWNDVRIALLHVQDVLVRAGHTLPSLAEVRAGLVGGQVTAADGAVWTLRGVLPMRGSGLSWVDIARETALLPLAPVKFSD